MLGYVGNSWSQKVIILLCRRNLKPCLELWILFPSSPSVKEGDERTEDSAIENHYSGLESKSHGVPEKTMVLRTRKSCRTDGARLFSKVYTEIASVKRNC